MSLVSEFNEYRSRMNEVILGQDNLVLKRFFSLDNQAYQVHIVMPYRSANS